MNIAIVSIFWHMECLGFLLETFREDSVTIIINYNTDDKRWIDYYKILFPNIIVNVNPEINNPSFEFIDNVVNTYDKVFCLTYNQFPHNKVKSIIHFDYERKDTIYGKPLISLTPYICGDDIIYTFPVYRAYNNTINNIKPIVTSIGFYVNDQIDSDTDAFISKNPNYTFYFIVWGDLQYPNLEKHSNVVILSNIPALQMVEIIKQSKYILSKKYINRDRFSGMLSLAMSFEKPIIIDKKTADTYNIPGKYYNTELNEIDELDTITDEKYDQMINEIRNFNDLTIEQNKITLRMI